MLKPFDVRVTGYKRKSVEVLPNYFDRIIYDLDEALETSEIIVITLPLTASTKELFNSERLARMKGKVIVNVGRGELINQKSIYENLKNGTLKGAAIDCWYNYPKNGETSGFPSDFPIYDLSNVVLSPLVAGYTSSASKENIREAFENLRSYLMNERTIGEVDLDFGY